MPSWRLGTDFTSQVDFSTVDSAHRPEAWPLWLGEPPADVPQLKALLAPCPPDDMICWLVSARVGNVKNNDPSLIEPIAGVM